MLILGLGTNIGDKTLNFENAIKALSKQFGPVVNSSKTYETEAWGFDSETFYNKVIAFNSIEDPETILTKCQQIEQTMGRVKNKTNAYEARIIDIDILLYNNIQLNKPELTIPHKLIQERKFVLIPLLEVLKGRNDLKFQEYSACLQACKDQNMVKPVNCNF